MVLHHSITKILLAVVLAVSACTLNAITITSEDQLIEEIKQLRHSFKNFDAIQDYIDEHCDTLENGIKIKSAIKNQFEYYEKQYFLGGSWLCCPTMVFGIMGFGVLEDDGKCLLSGLIGVVSAGIFLSGFLPYVVRMYHLKWLYNSFAVSAIDSELSIKFENK